MGCVSPSVKAGELVVDEQAVDEAMQTEIGATELLEEQPDRPPDNGPSKTQRPPQLAGTGHKNRRKKLPPLSAHDKRPETLMLAVRGHRLGEERDHGVCRDITNDALKKRVCSAPAGSYRTTIATDECIEPNPPGPQGSQTAAAQETPMGVEALAHSTSYGLRTSPAGPARRLRTELFPIKGSRL